MNIILCGLPKSGKTTLGKLLADKLKWSFIDTDKLIEKAYAEQTGAISSCRTIALQEGDIFFRALEKTVISSLKEMKTMIIATGGGSLNDPDNIDTLQSIGELVYLKTPLEVVWQRLQKKELPTYLNAQDPQVSFYTLAKTRIPIYEKAANFHIDTHLLTKEAIVITILKNLLYGK
jgi:shikimate kinase